MNTKLYIVEFYEYDNIEKTKVSNTHGKYIDVTPDDFLAREEHLDYLNNFGKGIKSALQVGQMFEMPPSNYSQYIEQPIILNIKNK